MLEDEVFPEPVVWGLKRRLARLRPILRPAWRRIRPFVERPAAWPAAGTAAPPIVAVVPDRIRPIAKGEFDRLAALFPYYRTRWQYMSKACSIAAELIARDGLSSSLELGPYVRSIIAGGDVMDLRRRPELEADREVVVHDATVVPWPIPTNGYDLFVALQVFEHLGDGQATAFGEVRRIARHAILSLPIDWQMDDPSNCHHGITHERALSWFRPTVPDRVIVGNGGPRKRLIYVFENLRSETVDREPAVAVADGR